jgi:hypothetical protein
MIAGLSYNFFIVLALLQHCKMNIQLSNTILHYYNIFGRYNIAKILISNWYVQWWNYHLYKMFEQVSK